MSTVSERVARGVAWLDGALPDWWKTNVINLSDFKMSDGCRCVIGQLYADEHEWEDGDAPGFEQACDDEWLDLSFDAATGYGFYAEAPGFTADNACEYSALEDEWRRVITERRAAA